MNASKRGSASSAGLGKYGRIGQAGRHCATAIFWAMAIVLALATATQAQTIRRVSAPGKFYVDDKSSAGIVYNYAIYAISNDTASTLTSPYVIITNLVPTNRITLAPIETGVRALGALEPGQTRLAGFFLKGPSFTGNSDTLLNVTNENHTIRVLSGPPGIGSTLASQDYGYTNIIFVIEAAANKVTIITNLNPLAVLGSEVALVIAGDTGTIGGNNSIAFSPGVLGSWRPDAYELVGSIVKFTKNPTFTNQMYFDPTIAGFTNYTGQSYTNTFTFRAVKVTGTNLPISPFAFIDSGSGTKHTDLTSLTSSGGSNVIYSATNLVAIIQHQVTPTSLLAPGGVVTYSVTFSNLSTTPLNLDEIVNTLPSHPDNPTYVPGSAIYNGSPVADPNINGQILRWAQPFALAPGAASVLTFQAVAPLTAGSYTNSVIGIIGNEVIDASLVTTDNSAATSVFTIIPVSDLALAKAAPATPYASSNFNYTLTITNLGPSPATGIAVSDTLPAGVTFVSASAGGVFNAGTVQWTNLGPVAANSSSNLIITVTAPPDAATLVNTAAVTSPILDPDATNNAAPPVVSTVIPVADLGIQKLGQPIIAAGSNFNYTLVITNHGPSLASNVMAADALAPNLTFVSASHGGVFSGGSVNWTNLGHLAANTSLSLTLTVTAPLAGGVTNTAAVVADTFDPVSTNGTSTPVVSVVGNVPPNTVNDTASTHRLAPVTVSVLANDSDDNGDILTLIGVTQTNGTAITAGNDVQFTPATNYVGAVALTYTVTDGQGGTNTGLLTINVTNRPPAAVDDMATATNGVPVDIYPLLNDSDADGDALIITNVTTTRGIVSIGGGGTHLTFTATNNAPATITYTISDGFGGSATAIISIGGLNVAPLTVDPVAVLLEDTSTNFVFQATDDETNLVFAILAGPTNGVLTAFDANLGSVIYTPATNYVGLDSFTFTVTDGSLYATGTVSITVIPVNDAPLADNLPVTTPEDTATNLVLTASDVDSTNLVFALLAGPTNGTLGTLNTNTGAVTYSPAPDFFGGDSFTFTVFDGSLYATGTVSITVTPVNDAPLANALNVTTPEDTATNLVLTASDLDSTNLTFAILTSPANGALGTLNTNTGAVTYSPAPDFFGGDSFTFTVFDGSLYATGTVSITVTPVNDAPIAVNDTATTPEDTPVLIPFLANDSDPDGDPLSVQLLVFTNGLVTVSGTNLLYTPSTNFTGTNVLTYTITDGQTNSTATVTVTVTPVNDAPVANNLAVTIPEDTATNLVLTASDVDSAGLTFAILAGPANGTLGTLDTNTGAVTYSPNTNYVGGDSFAFTVFDGALYATGTVSITVTPLNDPPVAVSDNAVVNEDSTNSIPVLVNDSDPDGDPLTLVSVTTTNGTATLSGTNVVYTPSTNFSGTNVMTYCATDGVVTNCASILVTVLAVNDAPVAFSQSVTNLEDTPLLIMLTGADVDGPVTNFTLVSLPLHGSLTGSGANLTYTPTNDYFGPDSFTFTVNDGSLTSAVATVSITVLPVNDAPVAVADSYTIGQNLPLIVAAAGVLTNDTDLEGNSLTALLVSNPANGTLTFNTNGGFTYTPTNDFTGVDSFTYRAGDGASNSAPATVTLTVFPLADVVVLKSGPTNVNPGQSFSYTITVTNFGPSTASNVVVVDSLPTNLVFVSASGGGAFSNSTVTWPALAALPKHARTNYTLTVTAPTNGTFINIASATATTPDPDPSNNDGSANASRVGSAVVPVEFGVRPGTNVFNPQTGLYEQTVIVTNTSSSTVAALRLLVGDFASTNGAPRTNVWLWNAHGTNFDGRRFVQYNSPLDPGQFVSLKLEFYNPTRVPFTNSLEVEATLPAPSTNLTGGVVIDRAFTDTRIPGEPRFVIEWVSVIGARYTVIYSDDLVTWTPATPSVTATATRTQWYDDGPPKTASKPLGLSPRYYRVILNP